MSFHMCLEVTENSGTEIYDLKHVAHLSVSALAKSIDSSDLTFSYLRAIAVGTKLFNYNQYMELTALL